MNKCLLALWLLAAAQDTSLDKVARALAGKIASRPEGFEDLFHQSFFRHVPAARIEAILRQLHSQNGKVASVAPHSRDSETSGVFMFSFENGSRQRVTLILAAGDHPKIIGLWFAPSGGTHGSLGEVLADLKKLPGAVDALRDCRQLQVAERLAAGPGWERA